MHVIAASAQHSVSFLRLSPREARPACTAVVTTGSHVTHPLVLQTVDGRARETFVRYAVGTGSCVLEEGATDETLARTCVNYGRAYIGVVADDFDEDHARVFVNEIDQERTLIPYASRTGTRATLEALRGAGWRLLVSATGAHRHEGFAHCLDNGAWTAFQQKEPFRREPFLKALDTFGPSADFVVIPDIVEGGMRSYDMSCAWIHYVQARTRRALFAVQDGISEEAVAALPLGEHLGLFVGGSTEWKESTMRTWGRIGEERGCWVHVGRVNTVSRIRKCADARVTSFDGTSVTKFVAMLPRLDNARRTFKVRRPA